MPKTTHFWVPLYLLFAFNITLTCLNRNSALHPSGVAKSSTSFGWGKGGKVTSAGWQVILCDLIWHVISRSGVVISITNCYIRFTYLLYLLCEAYSVTRLIPIGYPVRRISENPITKSDNYAYCRGSEYRSVNTTWSMTRWRPHNTDKPTLFVTELFPEVLSTDRASSAKTHHQQTEPVTARRQEQGCGP